VPGDWPYVATGCRSRSGWAAPVLVTAGHGPQLRDVTGALAVAPGTGRRVRTVASAVLLGCAGDPVNHCGLRDGRQRSARTRSSWRRSATSSAATRRRRRTPWSCAWARGPGSRPSAGVPSSKRPDQVIYYQFRANRARRTLQGIDGHHQPGQPPRRPPGHCGLRDPQLPPAPEHSNLAVALLSPEESV